MAKDEHGGDGAARLAAGLRAMDRLHALSAAAREAGDLDRLLEAALDAAMAAQRADFGALQLSEPAHGTLSVAAQRGFGPAFLEHFAQTGAGDGLACDRALAERQAVAIADVAQDAAFARHGEVVAAAGFRAIVSAPLLGADGAALGVLSTHFRAPRAFDDGDRQVAEILGREAARAIERARIEVALVREAAERAAAATERERAEAARREVDARYRLLFDAIDEGFCVIEVLFDEAGRSLDYRFLEANASFERQTGLGDPVGRRMRDLAPEHEQHWFDIYGEIARTGAPQRFERPAEALGHWYDVYAFRVGEPAQRRVAILFNDISERKRAEVARTTLLAELQHRVRNVLAVVRAMVRRTIDGAESVQDVAELLDGRLTALARTQAMLTRDAGSGADLEMLVREELLGQAVDDDMVTVEGPAVRLSPRATEVLSLAMHELATNAIKYGAIGQRGRLSVTWRREAQTDGPEMLRLMWIESGVRVMARQPRRPGFGTELIERRVPYDLHGEGRLDLRPGGLHAEISFPLIPGESILSTDAPDPRP